MGVIAAITVGPATVRIIRHHERYGEAAINVCHCRQGFLDDVASDVLGTKLTQRVEEDRNVVLAHRVHGHERQGQIARVLIPQRTQVGLKP